MALRCFSIPFAGAQIPALQGQLFGEIITTLLFL
jgi:hypothetical protein